MPGRKILSNDPKAVRARERERERREKRTPEEKAAACQYQKDYRKRIKENESEDQAVERKRKRAAAKKRNMDSKTKEERSAIAKRDYARARNTEAKVKAINKRRCERYAEKNGKVTQPPKTPEEKAEEQKQRNKRNAAMKKEKRQNESPDEKVARLQKAKEKREASLMKLTPEERELKKKRPKLKPVSPEELKNIPNRKYCNDEEALAAARLKNTARIKLWRKNNPVLYRKKRREYMRKKRGNMTIAERIAFNKQRCIKLRQRIAKMSPAEKHRYYAKERDRGRKRYQNNAAYRTCVLSRGRRSVTCPHCGYVYQANTIKHHINFHRRCAELLRTLSPSRRQEIEEGTRTGHKCRKWRLERRGRITATRAHSIWRLRTADPKKIVRSLMHLHTTSLRTMAMKRGIALEETAVNRFRTAIGAQAGDIQYPVGLIIHPLIGYVAATPDALKGSDGCVEIKCPLKPVGVLARNKNNRWLNMSSLPGGRYLERNGNRAKRVAGNYRLNRKHKYFTQVAVQIMCSCRQYCDFVIYWQDDANPNNWELWTERIGRKEAQDHWMELFPKLQAFYNKHMGVPKLM